MIFCINKCSNVKESLLRVSPKIAFNLITVNFISIEHRKFACIWDEYQFWNTHIHTHTRCVLFDYSIRKTTRNRSSSLDSCLKCSREITYPLFQSTVIYGVHMFYGKCVRYQHTDKRMQRCESRHVETR